MKGYKSFTTVENEVILTKAAISGQVVLVGKNAFSDGGEMAVVDFKSGSGEDSGIYFKSFRSERRLRKLPITVTVVGINPSRETPDWAKQFK